MRIPGPNGPPHPRPELATASQARTWGRRWLNPLSAGPLSSSRSSLPRARALRGCFLAAGDAELRTQVASDEHAEKNEDILEKLLELDDVDAVFCNMAVEEETE